MVSEIRAAETVNVFRATVATMSVLPQVPHALVLAGSRTAVPAARQTSANLSELSASAVYVRGSRGVRAGLIMLRVNPIVAAAQLVVMLRVHQTGARALSRLPETARRILPIVLAAQVTVISTPTTRKSADRHNLAGFRRI